MCLILHFFVVGHSAERERRSRLERMCEKEGKHIHLLVVYDAKNIQKCRDMVVLCTLRAQENTGIEMYILLYLYDVQTSTQNPFDRTYTHTHMIYVCATVGQEIVRDFWIQWYILEIPSLVDIAR